jgi:hypothetical protein
MGGIAAHSWRVSLSSAITRGAALARYWLLKKSRGGERVLVMQASQHRFDKA